MSYKHAFYILFVLFVALSAYAFTQAVPEVITVVEYKDTPVLVHDINIYQFRSACSLPVEEAPEYIDLFAGAEEITENQPVVVVITVTPEQPEEAPEPPYHYRHCETGNGNSTLCIDEAPGKGHKSIQKTGKINGKN